jgi:hypothetical protein
LQSLIAIFSEGPRFSPLIAFGDTAVKSPYWIRYKYTDDLTTCTGKDSIKVHVYKEVGNIQIRNEKEIYCSNDDTVLLVGFNKDFSNGLFRIEGGIGLIDNKNNTAFLLPWLINSSSRDITYTFTISGIPDSVKKTIQFETVTSDFVWDNECFSKSEKIIFTDQSKSESPINYSKWIVHYPDKTVYYTDNPISVTFDKLSNYKIDHIVRSVNNCSDTSTKELILKPTYSVGSSNYFDNFSGKPFWNSQSFGSTLQNSWTLDRPTGDIFKTPAGEKVWYTKIKSVQFSEQSEVISPCFDFSNSQRPMIKMDIWRGFNLGNVDGAVLQYTADNGKSWSNIGRVANGINWYNSDQIDGNPGGQTVGWSNYVDTSWIECRHVLDKLVGQSQVRFKIAYGSVNLNLNKDGFAFDNVWIGERTKKSIIEHFINNCDTTCKAVNEEFNLFANENSKDIIDLQYHMSRSGRDTFYILNPLPSDSREIFYGIEDIPYSLIDGGRDNNPLYEFKYKLNKIKRSDFELASLGDNIFNIGLNSSFNGNSLHIESEVIAQSDIALGNYSLQIVIIENKIEGIVGDNGETTFENVVRDVLPGPSGTGFYRNWSTGNSEQVSLDWEINNIFDPDELRVVAYMQNDETKEIYQAAIDNPNIVTDINEDHLKIDFNFALYPNPAYNKTSLVFRQPLNKDTILQILDNTGRVIYQKGLSGNEAVLSVPLNAYKPGIYLFKVISGKQIIGIQKLILLSRP